MYITVLKYSYSFGDFDLHDPCTYYIRYYIVLFDVSQWIRKRVVKKARLSMLGYIYIAIHKHICDKL